MSAGSLWVGVCIAALVTGLSYRSGALISAKRGLVRGSSELLAATLVGKLWGSLYLTWREDMAEARCPLISSWFDVLVSSLLSLPPSDQRLCGSS